MALTVKLQRPASGAGGQMLRASGYESLACSVLEQAIYDYRTLRQRGIINQYGNTIPDEDWPRGETNGERKNIETYRNTSDVQQLIWFIDSDYFANIADDLGIDVDGIDVLERIESALQRDLAAQENNRVRSMVGR